ncbi:MAG: PQQ-binding-like beta-propeller repeat protein [Acidobacteriota bacterium]|nr:PQQ-binding-like beta-propeller repeat protein [Acidobacteriota bacterium]
MDFDLADGTGVRWQADLGSYSYAGPVVAAGKVFVGTNNASPRDLSKTDDLGVLMVFDAIDGTFLWQATHAKREQDIDFPLQGLCSTPAVVGDRAYYVSNRAELVSVDAEGFRDGKNDGPFADEPEVGIHAADVIWSLDLHDELGVTPHFMAASTPEVGGDLVFAVTSNGIAQGGGVPSPEAPSFVAVRRETGDLVWSSAAPGSALIDGQWASPRRFSLGGRERVLFPGGDGWLRAFEATAGAQLWQFDGNAIPAGREPNPRALNVFVATPTLVGARAYLVLGRDPEKGSGDGGLWALDLAAGDGPEVTWFVGGDDFGRAIADAAVADGVVYAADLDGFVVAVDADTGVVRWRYDAFAPIWATPLVTPAGVWIADTDGEIVVLGTGPELEILAELETGSPIYRAPVVDGSLVYLMTTDSLYAIDGKE